MVNFTLQDAHDLITIAQDAPIPGGARMAVARTELYKRFAAWHDEATKALAEREAQKVPGAAKND